MNNLCNCENCKREIKKISVLYVFQTLDYELRYD